MGLVPLVAQTVKRLSTMQETRVQSLGQEDPLEKESHQMELIWAPNDKGRFSRSSGDTRKAERPEAGPQLAEGEAPSGLT